MGLRTFSSHSRLSFRLPDGFRSEWKDADGGRGFELLIRGAVLTDLGAPLGEEKAWIAGLPSFSDSRLSGLRLVEREEGVVVSGAWKFPQGDRAPASPRMEHFEYRDKELGRFVVDFWMKDGPTVAQVRREREEVEKKDREKKQAARVERRAERKLAAEKVRRDLEDVVAFCKRPLRDDSDVFIEFEPVRQPFTVEKELRVPMPDFEYPWSEADASLPDGKYVRLARKLYEEGKFALVLKTIEFFEAEHNESIYRREMRFMRANARLKLGLAADARADLEEILLNSPESYAAEQSAIWLAIEALKQGNQLGALERFLWLIRHHGSSPRAWVFHMAAAEALAAMRQTERAAKEYQWVAQNAPDSLKRTEGAVRIGDLFFMRRQYERSLASYFQAADYFPKEASRFPSLALNRAESLYWLGQHDRAREVFAQFLNDHPNHPGGWRAHFRIGEILGRKDGDAARKESRASYLEAVNRHPFSAGAILARLRLLPCDDHGGFDATTAARFFDKEVADFDGSGEIRMERWRDFVALARIRSWISLGFNRRAIDAAIQSLEGGSQTEVKKQILTLLKLVFRKEILALLEAGRRIEALRFYGSRIDQFPSIRIYRDDQVDPDYLLKLSQAANELQLGEVAEGLLIQYQQAQLSRGKALAESGESGGGRSPASRDGEEGEDDDDFEGNRERSELAFTEAESLWLKSGPAEAGKVLEKLQSVRADSARAYAARILASRIEALSGRPREALREALAARMLMPVREASIAGETERVDHWIAELQLKTGDVAGGMASIQGLLAREQLRAPASSAGSGIAPGNEKEVSAGVAATGTADRAGIPSGPSKRELLLSKASILEKSGRWGEAASAYSQVFGGSADAVAAEPDYVRFGWARALSKTDRSEDREKARGLFRSLASDAREEVWKKLARENLDAFGPN